MVAHLANRGREPVAMLGHGLDPFRTVLAERLAQRGDLEGQVGFLDDGVGPELPDQLVALQDRPAPFDQHQQQVERFRGEGDGAASQTDHPSASIEAISAELVDGRSIAHGLKCETYRIVFPDSRGGQLNPLDACDPSGARSQRANASLRLFPGKPNRAQRTSSWPTPSVESCREGLAAGFAGWLGWRLMSSRPVRRSRPRTIPCSKRRSGSSPDTTPRKSSSASIPFVPLP